MLGKNRQKLFVSFSILFIWIFYLFFYKTPSTSSLVPFESRDTKNECPSLQAISGLKANRKVEMRMDLNTTKHRWPWGEDKYNTLERCNEKQYNYAELPKASIIICFHETEQFENLLHTVHSIIQHTPDEILLEIILVDDNSHKEIHRTYLSNYVDAVFGNKVRFLHNPGPDLWGVIIARLHGIRAALAPVVVVLDAHMELRERWLEPLLLEIANDRRTLASVTLDWMKPQDDVATRENSERANAYVLRAMGKGVETKNERPAIRSWVYEHGPNDAIIAWFWQQFAFTLWEQESKENTERLKTDPTQPFLNPATQGHWAMDRNFFEEIGALDEGMKLWGGENIDLAIRTYLWNGRVLNIPCSHGAHLEGGSQRGYRNDWGEQIKANYKRIAEVWLDEYKDTYYHFNPDNKLSNAGDLTERMQWKAKCPNTFRTFLEKGFPKKGLPFNNTIAKGGFRCLAVPEKTMYWENPWTYGIRKQADPKDREHHEMFLTEEGNLRSDLAFYNAEKEKSGKLIFTSHTVFKDLGPETQWFHKQGGLMKASTFNGCMQAVKNSEVIALAACDDNNPYQQWQFGTYTEQYIDLSVNPSKQRTGYKERLAEYLSSVK